MSFAKILFVKTCSAFLIFALLVPFALKLEHIFENHKHSVCTSKVENHIHQLNDDCDFLNYTITSFNYTQNFVNETFIVNSFPEKNYNDSIAFFSSQKATSSLRGPPSLS
ncbi:MAG: hypothetical protein COZ16_07700 [Flavobacteriaceae bacterium CG_4_10_14_3_um_filter_31_253]|nr:hypothetical protein [Flavobacteriia bacterium]OIP47763.1 MAG: hypothetical protein AUK46_04490 [Flavobacteriaceae bacterium CG2_30_31_66]PIV97453.1 MAG: hypothetical protein COW43_03460 [Flavobacteriaceae bacterium CG17_big_fil_post_rev_8_21_14_2_50_31_13]PIX12742.1 MAG: hypothetical protein COZ74_09920 [Flavobacteriaceae bacterium CG_4_8_14_3_um_filter_31_8]PIY14812.1 MAG: hypothetical protein COZ16_07700 [Flavobacteriaceae bacterium CG_4_10_14_3_um_filter_31_253]PIZ12160.1 MAG: hypotheti